ncbi:hypothetical protein Poli38472_010792 [Pythium oligandrum]|uniref:NADP-dependent oxidoreductase domain-containing protein n=1 Tax=Pythium oligandrum TaxID=41045 RepID=A0A8K1CEU2_PYTOL|nr:hypothetical protein Poli38472_010792 [Pythium oligandrum]|eukprot:TMW61729.1 hypothetical protein Poli38472_010792 [Pythium oligandrum]
MAAIAIKQLPSGALIPVIGLGVFQSEPGAETYNAVLSALKIGYRHIDTAHYYSNEADVGRAIVDSGVPREQVFVTTKYFSFSWSYNDVVEAVKKSVERIGGGYIDLYLLHAPCNPKNREDAWRALEDMQKEGLVRDIASRQSDRVHPFISLAPLVKYCESQDILLQAYSPLVQAKKMNDPTLNAIAMEVEATPAQVLLAWTLAKCFITLPKSVKESRQKENLDSYKVKLSEDQVARLDTLDEHFLVGWDAIETHAV